MTYWADNIKFIKDILDSKYKKIEDAITELEEHSEVIAKDNESKRSRDHFSEAARTLELIDTKEMGTLAETMFKDMPESEREKEMQHLKEVENRYQAALEKVKEFRAKYGIK